MSHDALPRLDQCCFCHGQTDLTLRSIGVMQVTTCGECVRGLIYERLKLMDRWPLVGSKTC